MVDYSKWDALEVSSSESDSGDSTAGEVLTEKSSLASRQYHPKSSNSSSSSSSSSSSRSSHRPRGPGGVYRVEPGQDLFIPGRNVTLKSRQVTGQQLNDESTGIVEVPFDQQNLSTTQSNTTTETSATAAAAAAAIQASERATTAAATTAATTTTLLSGLNAWAKDGAVHEDLGYAWSQEANTIVVSISVPSQTRASAVNVALAGPRGPLRVTVAQHHQQQKNKVMTKKEDEDATKEPFNTAKPVVAVNARLFADVIVPSEDDGGIDWELQSILGSSVGNFNKASVQKITAATTGTTEQYQQQPPPPPQPRAVRVTLDKAPVLGGAVTMWWKSAFEDGPEVDTTKLTGRSPSRKRDTHSFADNFAKAQAMFREKMAQRRAMGDTRTEVDLQ